MLIYVEGIRDCEGFIIIYSITSRESFEQIAGFRDQVMRVKDCTDLPLMLVGNKSDLEEKREVSRQEGEDLSKVFAAGFKEVKYRLKALILQS